MKSTFRIAVIAAGFAVAAWPVLRAADESAQPSSPPPPAAGGANATTDHQRHGRRDGMEQLEHLKHALDLSPEQCGQIAAIIKGGGPARQSIMADDSLSRDQKRAKMHELMKGTQTEIRAVLTPEQQKKFDSMPRPERKMRDGGAGSGNPPPPPPPGNAPAPATPPAASGT
jgi:Spy/CpxP family protein refolding chaperone